MKDYKREKLLYSIIFFASKIKDLSITQLMKFLSQLDYRHFKETGTTVTGLIYHAYDQGEYSKSLNEEIKNRNPELLDYIDIIQTKKGTYDATILIPNKKFDDKYFTKRQLKILNDLVYIFKGYNAKQMSLASHERSRPWDITIKQKGKYQEIDFMLAIDDINFKEFLKKNIKDREVIEKALN